MGKSLGWRRAWDGNSLGWEQPGMGTAWDANSLNSLGWERAWDEEQPGMEDSLGWRKAWDGEKPGMGKSLGIEGSIHFVHALIHSAAFLPAAAAAINTTLDSHSVTLQQQRTAMLYDTCILGSTNARREGLASLGGEPKHNI